MPVERPDWSNELVPAGEQYPSPEGGLESDLTDALRDPTVARRYQGAVERDGLDDARLSWSEARGQLPAELVVQWDASQAPDGHHLAQAQNAAISALERPSFDGLPAGVRTAILTELGLGSAAIVRTASDTEIAGFKETPEGAIAAERWRGRTGKNVATANMRVNRMLAGMTADEREAAVDWYTGLSPEAQAGVLEGLVRR